MPEETITQAGTNSEFPTPKQFQATFKKIFDAETTFGSSRAARLELLESVMDIIQEYLKHESSIIYLYGKLKEAGYTGSRKELSEWFFSKDLRTKREITEKVGEKLKSLKMMQVTVQNLGKFLLPPLFPLQMALPLSLIIKMLLLFKMRISLPER